MSDYPMLISNKLHSFRNFYNTKIQNNLLIINGFPLFLIGFCEDFVLCSYVIRIDI